MPRTKQVKRPEKSKESVLPKGEYDAEHFEFAINMSEMLKSEILEQKKAILSAFKLGMKEEKFSISVSVRNKKLKDIKQGNLTIMQSISTFTGSGLSMVNSMLHPRNNTHTTRNLYSDEGYLTSESGTGNSGGVSQPRRSRRSSSASKLESNTKVKKSTRVSRSSSRVSRSTKTGLLVPNNKYKTPQNTRNLDTFGMVTPKVKPNTPQVVYRRPQIGEMAISLQGSPLLTNPASETNANLNIPLPDGRMINIQAIRGLRTSELPEFEPEVQRQLRTLKENLDKVCSIMN